MKIHPIMNMSSIKPFLSPKDEQKRYKPGADFIDEDEEEEWAIKKIADSHYKKDKL